jgi:RNA polymerase sigma-70 factor (ECF subfamily)
MMIPLPSHEAPADRAAARCDRFTALYRAQSDRVYALCLRMTGDSSRAVELAQDVFVHLWHKLDQLHPDKDAGAWVWRLATNVVLNELRAERRRQRREELTAAPDLAVAESAAVTPLPIRRMDLDTALAKLPPRARAVFLLHVEGYSHEEIARELRIAPGTARAQLHRARALMRERLRA